MSQTGGLKSGTIGTDNFASLLSGMGRKSLLFSSWHGVLFLMTQFHSMDNLSSQTILMKSQYILKTAFRNINMKPFLTGAD